MLYILDMDEVMLHLKQLLCPVHIHLIHDVLLLDVVNGVGLHGWDDLMTSRVGVDQSREERSIVSKTLPAVTIIASHCIGRPIQHPHDHTAPPYAHACNGSPLMGARH